MIVAQEVDELAFLFGRELGPDPHHLGCVCGVDPHRLSLLEWAEGHRGGWFVAVQDCWVDGSPSHGSSDKLMTVVASLKCSRSHMKACEKVLPMVMTLFGPGIFIFR